jgi:hypothetical protein
MAGPPFESSTPIVIACGVAAAIAVFVWTRAQTRPWLVAAVLACMAGGATFLADRLVITDREFLLNLFPQLATAAERQDVDTILAAIDPDLRPVRDEAAKVLRQVKPTEVKITRLKVDVDRAKQPAEARVDMIVRVTGNLIQPAGQGTALADVRVSMHEKNGRWLVRDAEATQAKPGQP